MNVDRQVLVRLDVGALPRTYGGERVLGAVSEQPSCDPPIRLAKRLTDALRAPWKTVVIETTCSTLAAFIGT